MDTTLEHPDGGLILRTRRDPVAFEEVFERWAPEVAAYVGRRVGREEGADALWETFSSAFRTRARFDGAACRPLPWLLGLATRVCRRRVDAEWRQLRLLHEFAVLGEVDVGGVVDARERAAVARDLRDLTSRHPVLRRRDRDLLALAGWTRLDDDGIASAVGVPVVTLPLRLAVAARRATRFAPAVRPADDPIRTLWRTRETLFEPPNGAVARVALAHVVDDERRRAARRATVVHH